MFWLATGVVAAALVTVAGAAADDSKYVSITMRGKLSDPETGQPMVGAVVRFTSNESGEKLIGIADEEGKFWVPGLTFGSFNVEVDTAQGERIKGIEAFPLTNEGAVDVSLTVSR